jgi:type IV pilus assembly protein PilV
MNGVQRKRQSGVGLIEVLVAAVILAIGLLGLAGLQTRSLQMNQSAQLRSQANYYAYEIVESMRVNRSAATAGAYEISMGDDAPSGSSVADEAVARWINGIQAALPMKGDETGGSIEIDGTTVTVTVAWLDQRWSDDEDDQIREVTVETEL